MFFQSPGYRSVDRRLLGFHPPASLLDRNRYLGLTEWASLATLQGWGHVGVNAHTTSKTNSRAHLPSWEGGMGAQNPCSRQRLVAGNISPPPKHLSNYQGIDSNVLLDQDYFLLRDQKGLRSRGRKSSAIFSTVNMNLFRLMVSVTR